MTTALKVGAEESDTQAEALRVGVLLCKGERVAEAVPETRPLAVATPEGLADAHGDALGSALDESVALDERMLSVAEEERDTPALRDVLLEPLAERLALAHGEPERDLTPERDKLLLPDRDMRDGVGLADSGAVGVSERRGERLADGEALSLRDASGDDDSVTGAVAERAAEGLRDADEYSVALGESVGARVALATAEGDAECEAEGGSEGDAELHSVGAGDAEAVSDAVTVPDAERDSITLALRAPVGLVDSDGLDNVDPLAPALRDALSEAVADPEGGGDALLVGKDGNAVCDAEVVAVGDAAGERDEPALREALGDAVVVRDAPALLEAE